MTNAAQHPSGGMPTRNAGGHDEFPPPTVVHHGRLSVPPSAPSGSLWRYGLGFILQLGPTTAAVLANIHIDDTTNYGYQNGFDLVLFDRLPIPANARTVPITRNEIRTDAGSAGRTLRLKSPVVGGFVPVGACSPNGRPHPHAGSGFGLGQAHDLPLGPAGEFVWWDPARRDRLELFDFAFDGRDSYTERTGVFTQDGTDPLAVGRTGWRIVSHGLTCAIPDADDLLLPVLAAQDERFSIGVARWTCRDGKWQPTAFLPVTDPDPADPVTWFEPSLARDADGMLLFATRGQDNVRDADGVDLGHLVRIWRSADAGSTWRIIVNVPELRVEAPVTIGMTGAGPYVVSNPHRPSVPVTPVTGRGRHRLVLWPLNAQRSNLQPPIMIRDAPAEFGPPPASPDPEFPEHWMADHPAPAVVRLAGPPKPAWHALIAYRLQHSPLYRSFATPPASATGCCIDEVHCSAPPVPLWTFDDDQ